MIPLHSVSAVAELADGSLVAIIDGVERNVPDDMANAHRRAIADWEAAGGVRTPYAAPAVDLVAYAARKRWDREVGGVSVGGVAVATDDRSKMMVLGARMAAVADPGFTTRWKTLEGAFVDLSSAQIVAISDAVLAHVDACFALEATVLADIAAGEITTAAEVDAAFG